MTTEQILTIKNHAALLLEHASAAYWSEAHREFLVRQILEDIKHIQEVQE